jgi:hypothetical protein
VLNYLLADALDILFGDDLELLEGLKVGVNIHVWFYQIEITIEIKENLLLI